MVVLNTTRFVFNVFIASNSLVCYFKKYINYLKGPSFPVFNFKKVQSLRTFSPFTYHHFVYEKQLSSSFND